MDYCSGWECRWWLLWLRFWLLLLGFCWFWSEGFFLNWLGWFKGIREFCLWVVVCLYCVV